MSRVASLMALAGVAVAALYLVRRQARRGEEPFVPARQRTFLGVHSTVRISKGRWRNWSRELHSTPGRLYCDLPGGTHPSPRTLEDLQAIVRDALQLGVQVRVFGSSHSWAALVPVDGGFLVDNRMIGAIGDRFALSVEPAGADGQRKARATCPPGLISKEFEEWLWEKGYTLPASAFEDCFTMGGMASTATHGVGLALPTVSDLVVGVTFVDGRGEVRRWTRETATLDELAAVQCGLGALGLVYAYTFEVEPRYEVMSDAFVVPYDSLFADTDEARQRLRDLHEKYATVELFWWPFVFSGLPFLSKMQVNPDLWVLTTHRTVPAGTHPRSALRKWLLFHALDLPSMIVAGYYTRWLARIPQLVWLVPLASTFTKVWVRARAGAQRVPQYDANHLVNAAGVEWMLCESIEWSLPFRPEADLRAPDGYERVRRSFDLLRSMVKEAWEEYPWYDPRSIPVTTAIEMRTLACSTALLSPGYQPDDLHGELRYAAPEIVSTAGHPAWRAFAEAANIRITTEPAAFGTQVRPHLAKQARTFPHPDHPAHGMTDYIREQYVAAGTWQRFLAVREAVDPDGVFLNPFLREWFCGPGVEAAPPRVAGHTGSAPPASLARRLGRLATVGVVIGVLPAFFALLALGCAPLPAQALLLGVISALLLCLERLLPRGGLGERPDGTFAVDLAYAAVSGFINVLVPAMWLVPFASRHALQWNGGPLWPQGLPVWLDIALCTLLADFVSYWWHRLEHDPRFPLLWRLHAVHHAPRYFDFWMGAHVHPLDVVVFILLTAGLAALLGVPPLAIEATMLLAATIGGVHHLDAETDCGWLNRLVPFADHHTVHHSRAADENGNFGNITTLFDQLFGTYLPPRPSGPQPTGAWSLVDDYPHTSLWFQLLSPFGRYWRRVARAITP